MKQNQNEVRYRRGYTDARKCAFCSMYRKDNGSQLGSCTAVTGFISPYGVCDLFEMLDNTFGFRRTRFGRHPRHVPPHEFQ